MSCLSKKIYIQIVGAVFLSVYLFTACLILLDGHNHEIDGRFHDNCPACQWEAQAQDYDPVQRVIMETIHIQHIRFSGFRESNDIAEYAADMTANIQSRAPPFLIFS